MTSNNQKRKTISYIYKVANFINNNFVIDRDPLGRYYDVNKFTLRVTTKHNSRQWFSKLTKKLLAGKTLLAYEGDSYSVKCDNGVAISIYITDSILTIRVS